MKPVLGLARHFQIPHSKRQWLSGPGFAEWIRWYDSSQAPHGERGNMHVTWHRCYSSDLRRAAFTAGKLHDGEVEFTPRLREVPFAPFFTKGPPLPLYIWETLSRLGWIMAHPSQPESRKQTRERVSAFLDTILAAHEGENVLVVSHGFLMKCFETELARRGYRGRVPVHPLGGEIHLFEP